MPTDVKTLPTVTVTKRVPVIPPANLLAYCVSIPSDGTIGGELQRLDNLAKCEHDRLDALNVWAAQNKPAADADLAPAPPTKPAEPPSFWQRNNPF